MLYSCTHYPYGNSGRQRVKICLSSGWIASDVFFVPFLYVDVWSGPPVLPPKRDRITSMSPLPGSASKLPRCKSTVVIQSLMLTTHSTHVPTDYSVGDSSPLCSTARTWTRLPQHVTSGILYYLLAQVLVIWMQSILYCICLTGNCLCIRTLAA